MTTIESLDPCADPRWAAMAADASLFESPRWLRVLRDAFAVDPFALVAIGQDGAATGGLPICRIDDIVGHRLSTLPFSDFAGLVGCPTGELWAGIADEVVDTRLPFRIRALDDAVIAADERLVEVGRAAWHDVELGDDLDRRWDELPSQARQNIRRARRMGVEVDVASTRAAVEAFERLHMELRRAKYGMLAQPPEFFDALSAEFGSDLAVVTGRVDGRAVAAILLLRSGAGAYYKFNASSPDALTYRANDLCMWEAMRFAAVEWGSTHLDLGLSDPDQPGLLRYKRKYATRTGSIVTRALDDPDVPSLSSEAQALARRVAGAVAAPGTPDDVCREISSAVYRYFC